jgi:hypothetical protein
MENQMETTANRTLESQPPSNIAAVSTPSTLDYDAIVKEIAVNKAKTGYSFSKGNGLFVSSCQKVKSLLSVNAKDRLPGEIATAIQDACSRLKSKALSVISADNLASTQSKVVLRNGLGHVKHTATAYDSLSAQEQILFSNININALTQKKTALELKYEETDKIDAQIAKWTANKILAEQALKGVNNK